MDVRKKKILNRYHVVFLVQNTMVGMGLLSMPFDLSSLGYSQWWVPIVYGLIANITLLPMIYIASKFPEQTIFHTHQQLLGKKLGNIFNTIIILYMLFIVSGVIERFLEMIQVTVLLDRTILGPLAFLLLVSVFISKGGIKSIARFCILAFFLVGALSVFARWGINEGNIRHLLPLFNFTMSDFIKATKNVYVSYLGYDLILVFYPFIIKQSKVIKDASLGIWITVVFYLIVTISSVMYFSEWQLENVLYPVLNLLKAVELSFVERMDTIGITLWVFLILTTVTAYMWAAKEGIVVIRQKESRFLFYILAIFMFVLVSWPMDRTAREWFYTNVNYIGYGYTAWPIVLIAIYKIQNRRRRVN